MNLYFEQAATPPRAEGAFRSAPILAIESSCDETAVAILRPPGTILSSLIASQAEEHARFGGVVPEVASRNHLLAVDPLVRRALSD